MFIKRLKNYLTALSTTLLVILGCEKMNGPAPFLSSPLPEEQLSILINMANPWKQEPPPPLMIVYVKDSPADTIKCSRLDPADGVTFLENGKMRVILTDANPNWEVNFEVIKTTRFYSTNLIDSITFPPPPPPPAEETPPPTE